MAKATIQQAGGASGLAAMTLPPMAFAVVNEVVSLAGAIAVALGLATVVLALRVVRRQPLPQAVAGLALAAVCAALAALTGQARSYFLIQTTVAVTSVCVCVGSVLVRRPLAGIVVNRLVGGPRSWWREPYLVRAYGRATFVCAAYGGISATLQVVFFLTNRTDGLAAINMADGPGWAAITVLIILVGRHAATHVPRSPR